MTIRLPEFVTFTGVDDNTDIARLVRLSSQYNVEWGVLFSKANSGKAKRYPHIDKMRPLLQANYNYTCVCLSAHVCGEYAERIMEGKVAQPLVTLLHGRYRRTQINVADGETKATQVMPGFAAAFGRLIAANRGVIVQCTGAHPDNDDVSWLFDASGGAGKRQTMWPVRKPGDKRMLGYAGGIGPLTIKADLEAIAKANGDGPYWIDMENNVRTDDWLDLDKCEVVLTSVYAA